MDDKTRKVLQLAERPDDRMCNYMALGYSFDKALAAVCWNVHPVRLTEEQISVIKLIVTSSVYTS